MSLRIVPHIIFFHRYTKFLGLSIHGLNKMCLFDEFIFIFRQFGCTVKFDQVKSMWKFVFGTGNSRRILQIQIYFFTDLV